MSDSPIGKQLRVGHKSERGGVNAVRTLLEAHNQVVDEVDGRNDYGRDLNVDLTDRGRVTGGVIGIQVRAGRSKNFKRGAWGIDGTKDDWDLWRNSNVPLVGVVWDPDSDNLRWENLSAESRARVDEKSGRIETPRLLNDETFDEFLAIMIQFVREAPEATAFRLFAEDDDERVQAVFDLWSIGRRDPRAFRLLRQVLPALRERSLVNGIHALSHLGNHPDILWHKGNWIPQEVQDLVVPSLRWTPGEIGELVYWLEEWEGGPSWHRGGAGQSLWVLMLCDPSLRLKLPRAIDIAVDAGRFETAIRLLICLQSLSSTPLDTVEETVDRHRIALGGHETVGMIVEHLQRWGRLDPVD